MVRIQTARVWRSTGRAVLAAVSAGLALAGCHTASVADQIDAHRILTASPASPEVPPEPVPAPKHALGSSRAIALPREADVGELSSEQIAVMFDASVEQSGPGEDKGAVCVAMQGLNDRQRQDAPASEINRLSERLRLPAVPASHCLPWLSSTLILSSLSRI
jgi:hypothetical protein